MTIKAVITSEANARRAASGHQPSGDLAFTWRWKCSAMEVERRALGPARTNFNDYVGTVAADDAEALLDQPSLSELAQIDRDRYTLLGIDLRVDGPTTTSICAIDGV